MDASRAELKRAGSFNRGGEHEQGDILAIEDLLDFSNEDIGGSLESYESCHTLPASSILVSGDELKASGASSIGLDKPLKPQQPACLLGGDVGVYGGELCVPNDDLADLEWLSNFVEETFSSGDGTVLEGVLHDDNAKRLGDCKQTQRASPVSVLDFHRRGNHRSTSTANSSSRADVRHLLLTPDQLYLSRPAGRARSKRPRSAVCFWNTRILSITDDCNILEASSTSKLTSQHQASSSSDSEDTLTLGYDDPDDYFISPMKKVCSSSKSSKSGKGSGGAYQKGGQHAAAGGDRKCLHCGSQRTPQWRAGPMGPKTLCNACGVRYKSGRLLPEYRPAASPTFVESVHSNSHRRVLEMRRQRADPVLPGGHANQLGVC